MMTPVGYVELYLMDVAQIALYQGTTVPLFGGSVHIVSTCTVSLSGYLQTQTSSNVPCVGGTGHLKKVITIRPSPNNRLPLRAMIVSFLSAAKVAI